LIINNSIFTKIYCAVLELLHATRQAEKTDRKTHFRIQLKTYKPEHDAG